MGGEEGKGEGKKGKEGPWVAISTLWNTILGGEAYIQLNVRTTIVFLNSASVFGKGS